MTLKSLLGGGALIAVGMLLGRLLGLLRETAMAAHFGTGPQADLAILLLLIPDFITGALVSGAASAVLIPAFTARSYDAALRLFWQVFLLSLGAFLILAIALLFAQHVLPHAHADSHAFYAVLLTLLSLPIAAVTPIVTAWLQTRKRFLAPAFATVFFNLAILLSLWLLPNGLLPLAVGILAASLLRLALQFLAFARSEGRTIAAPFTDWQIRTPLLRAYLSTTLSGIFSYLPTYMPYLLMVGGGLALFNYAFKLALLPAILAQTVISMLLLPWFVERKTNANAHADYTGSLLLGWLLSLSLCLSLWLCAPALDTLCFGYGKMTLDALADITQLFTLGIWVTPGLLLTAILQQIFFAHEQTRPPLIASALQLALILPAGWLAQHVFDASGVMLAYALVQFAPLFWLIRAAKTGGLVPSLGLHDWGITTTALVLAFLPLAALHHWLTLSLTGSVLLAALIGVILLAVSCIAWPRARASMTQWRRR